MAVPVAVVVPVAGAAEPVVSVVVGAAVVAAVEAVSVVVGAAVVAVVSVAVVAVVAVVAEVSVAFVFSSFLHANAKTKTASRHSAVKAFFIISSFIDF